MQSNLFSIKYAIICFCLLWHIVSGQFTQAPLTLSRPPEINNSPQQQQQGRQPFQPPQQPYQLSQEPFQPPPQPFQLSQVPFQPPRQPYPQLQQPFQHPEQSFHSTQLPLQSSQQNFQSPIQPPQQSFQRSQQPFPLIQQQFHNPQQSLQTSQQNTNQLKPPLFNSLLSVLENRLNNDTQGSPGSPQLKNTEFLSSLLARLEMLRPQYPDLWPQRRHLILTINDGSASVNIEFEGNDYSPPGENWPTIVQLLSDALALVIRQAEMQGYTPKVNYSISLDRPMEYPSGRGLGSDALKSAAG